jgi:hypothetical protein
VAVLKVSIAHEHRFYNMVTAAKGSHGSSVCPMTRLRAGRPRFDTRQVQVSFSLYYRVQTGSGVHPASYPVGTRSSFLAGKAAGA